MGDLNELYQEVILDHNKRPRNFQVLEPASHHAEGYNPLCGDRLTLYLRVQGETIEDIGFQGSGCAISRASASLMTDAVKGRSVEEARSLFERFHRMVTTPTDLPVEDLGKLSVLAGVREFPVRVKCASLAWHTLKAALAREERTSTE
ncbi:MAG TPA: SUF system NifU family Fe-S cluster assembly protein [Vicinamibacterales bacterium]|nr:SUF system NifU family Fe-S cluster assembly protein [Vicinamibacterales bacterium]